MWVGAVTALPGHSNIEKVSRCHAGAWAYGHVTGRGLGGQVQAVDTFDARVVEHPSFDHGLGPGKDFLGRLKNKYGGARQGGSPGGEDLGQRDANGRVPIVAAGVHHSGFAGGKWGIEKFCQG